MLDKVDPRKDKAAAYSRWAGTSSELLTTSRQQPAAGKLTNSSQQHLQGQTRGAAQPSVHKRQPSTAGTASDCLSLRSRNKEGSVQGEWKLTLHIGKQQQHKDVKQANSSPKTPRSPDVSPSRNRCQHSANSPRPASPASPAAASGRSSRPGTPPHAAAFTAEELLRAARCQDPASPTHSPSASPRSCRVDPDAAARVLQAAWQATRPDAGNPSACMGLAALKPLRIRIQPEQQLQQQPRRSATVQQHQQQQQQPRGSRAVPQPLIKHWSAAAAAFQQQPEDARDLQQDSTVQHGILQQAHQQQQQQQQRLQQDSIGPHAEASFGYLAEGPSSSRDSSASPPVAGAHSHRPSSAGPGQAPVLHIQCSRVEITTGSSTQQAAQHTSLPQQQQEDQHTQLQQQRQENQSIQLQQQQHPSQQQQLEEVELQDEQQHQHPLVKQHMQEATSAAHDPLPTSEQEPPPQQLSQQQSQQQGQQPVLELGTQQQQQQQQQQQGVADAQLTQPECVAVSQVLQEQQPCPQGHKAAAPRDVSPDKQQQLLARLCAKHGLPLPHPRHVSQKQQQSSIWGPSRHLQQQHGGRVTQRGGEVARRRQVLLEQLKHSSMSRRKQPALDGEGPQAQTAAQTAGSIHTDAGGDAVPGADVSELDPTSGKPLQPQPQQEAASIADGQEAEAEATDQQQQQQQMVVYSLPPAPPSPSASGLHLVDGLQYVHALLGSITMPSAAPAAEDGTASHAGGASSGMGQQQQLQGSRQLLLGQQAPETLLLAPAGTQMAAGTSQQQRDLSMLPQPQPQQQQQQQLPIEDGDMRTLCSIALAKLRAATSGPADDDSLRYMLPACSSSQLRQHHPVIPLQAALAVLCMLDSNQHNQQQSLQQQEVQGCFTALHNAVRQYMRPPRGDPLHQDIQPGWHKQQQQELVQGLCCGPLQLGLRAVAAVAASHLSWQCEELQTIRQSLQQVQQQLWHHQALAEVISSRGCLPGSPSKAAAGAAPAFRPGGSPNRQGSPSRRATTAATAAAAGRSHGVTCSRLSPERSRAVLALSASRKQPLAATALAKRLSVAGALRGTVDYKATCEGWEGKPLVIKLLCELRNKLLCKLILHALRIAVAAARQRDALLLKQLPSALSALQLSTAFTAWKAWSADRAGVRGRRQDLRDKVQLHKTAAALRAWREAAEARAWLRARQEAMLQRRERLLLLRAFKAWGCVRAQQQLASAQQAVALLWHARVLSTRVLTAWSREARQAVLLAAMAWDDSESGDVSSANTSRNPSRRQSTSCGFDRCSADLAAALALQRPWRQRALASVAEARDRCDQAHATVDGAAGELRAQLPPLLVSAQVLLSARRQQRLLWLQQQHMADGWEESSQDLQCSRDRQRPRVEWSAQLLADDSSSYVVCPSGFSSRRVSVSAGDADTAAAAGFSSCCVSGGAGDADATAAAAGFGSRHESGGAGDADAAAAAGFGSRHVCGGAGDATATAAAVLRSLQWAASAAEQQALTSLQEAVSAAAAAAGVQSPTCHAGQGLLGEAARQDQGLPTGGALLQHAGSSIAGAGAASGAASAGIMPQLKDCRTVNATADTRVLEGSLASPVLLQQIGDDAHLVLPSSADFAATQAVKAPDEAAAWATHAMPHLAACQRADGPSGTDQAAATAAGTGTAAAGTVTGAVDVADEPGTPVWQHGGAVVAPAGDAAAAGAGAGGAAAIDAAASIPGYHYRPEVSHSTVEQQQQQQQLVGMCAQSHDVTSHRVMDTSRDAIMPHDAVGCAAAVGQRCQHVEAAAAAACDGENLEGAVGSEAVTSRPQPGQVGHGNAHAVTAVSTGRDACDTVKLPPLAAGRVAKPETTSAAAAAAATTAAPARATGSAAGAPNIDQPLSSSVIGRDGATCGDSSSTSFASPDIAAGGPQSNPAEVHPPLDPRQQRQLAAAACYDNTTAAAAGQHRVVQVSDGELLQRSMHRWLSDVRGKALLVRVFTAAEAAWESRTHEALLALEGGSQPHIQDFRLMRRAFNSWASHTAQQLQGAAALAALEAAAAYYSSRLAVRAWKAWRTFVSQAPAVQQRYCSALASVCLLGWRQHTLQQRQDPQSRSQLRLRLRTATGGVCGSKQQWRRLTVLLRVLRAWRGVVWRGEDHYRLRLLAAAMTSWELAVEETQQRLLVFRSRWEPRLLQHALLLWRSLVLLLKQQRGEAAYAQAWRDRRLATHALQFWAGYAAARAAQRGAVAAAVRLYEQKLLRRKLLQWSLVACATSAARAYRQHKVLQKVVAAWRGVIAANRVDALRLELQQQQGAGTGGWEPHPRPAQQLAAALTAAAAAESGRQVASTDAP